MRLVYCILVFSLVLVAIKYLSLDKASRRMIFFFVAYWLIASLLSIFQVFGLNTVSDYTYTLVYIHLISFTIGYLSIHINRNSTESFLRAPIDTQINNFTKNPLFLVVLIVSTIYVVVLFSSFYQLIIAMGSMNDARAEYYEGGGSIYGTTFVFINQFLLQPLNTLLLPIFAYKLYYKRDLYFWLITVFIFSSASLSGGRFAYVRIAVVTIFVLFCLFDKVASKSKLFGIMTIGAVGLYLILIITSAARFGALGLNKKTFEIGSEVMSEHLSTYSAGSIAALDYSIANDYLTKVGGYKYGRLTGTSVDRMVCMVLRRFGINAVDAMDSVVEMKQNDYIALGDVSFNALYTSIFIYYLDFGIFGVIFIPFFIGRFVRYCIKQMYRYNTLPFMIIVSWFFFIMMKSVMDFAFYNPSDIILLLLLLWFGKRKKQQV